jgi:predicted lipoprotein with Yx(FWY)xxD motif
MNRTVKTVALATLVAATAVSLTACDPSGSEPTGTVVARTGGAPMKAKGATLIVHTKDGKTATVVLPAGIYESCYIGEPYPKCK